MANPFDTIVAACTAVPGPVAIVRLSGESAWHIAGKVFSPWRPEPMRAQYGRCANGDDGIALAFAKGTSYTGEETVEISIHGSLASVRSLTELCLAAGARMAEAGEFTRRAFMNGRIDLTQAEAVRDSIEAQTDLQLRNASRLREGGLSKPISRLRQSLLSVLAAMEASVDFSEEVGPFDPDAARDVVESAMGTIEELLLSGSSGRWVREGYRIAIVGPPNAGKSSLLNALLGNERAIVTDIPGTTRDTIEERIDVEGIPVVLTDTAGIRESSDPAEWLGIQRTKLAAANADAIWYVFDSQRGMQDLDREFLAPFNTPVLLVANKSDLVDSRKAGILAVSALTGDGLSDLRNWIVSTVNPDDFAVMVARRHQTHLFEIAEGLREISSRLREDTPPDLLSVLMNEALYELGQITGETASEDMLSRIFRDFCVGK